jgi:hypothetical protein
MSKYFEVVLFVSEKGKHAHQAIELNSERDIELKINSKRLFQHIKLF